MKRCPKCEATKPLSEFHKDKTKTGGYASHCKECVNGRRRGEYESGSKSQYYLDNREVILAASAAWQAARKRNDPEGMRAAWREQARRQDPVKKHARARRERMKRHGGLDEWQRMFEEQDGLCYLCRQPLPDDVSAIHVDHDHACCPGGKNTRSCTQCRRGLTHERCNQIWGLARENPEMLRMIAVNGERVRDETKARIAESSLAVIA